MEVLRVQVKGWTASFRFPVFVSGFQPSLPVPPPSTVFGLLSAARGETVRPDEVKMGYVFRSNGGGVDLETVYELGASRTGKTNVLKREILYEPELFIYILGPEFEDYFRKPFYPLLLGRSCDIAMVTEIAGLKLVQRHGVRLGGTALPYGLKGAHGVFQSLPTHFSDTLPRMAKGTRPFILAKDFFLFDEVCWCDEEKNWGGWIHDFGGDAGEV